MQLKEQIDDETLASVFQQSGDSVPMKLGERVVNSSGSTESFAFTVVRGSFTQGTNPLVLDYTNTTLWCSESREDAAPLISRALAAAAETCGEVLQSPVAEATALAPGPGVPGAIL